MTQLIFLIAFISAEKLKFTQTLKVGINSSTTENAYRGTTKYLLKLWIYEIHIFELRNEEINVKKILAVINATYAVAKRKPEKIRLAGIRTLTSAIPVQRSNQLGYQARIFFTFISSFRSSNIWISYIHNFIFIFPGYITNQFNDQLPVDQLPIELSSEDLLYIYFFIPQFKYMNLTYS